MRILIFSVLGILLLAGAGVGAYMFHNKSAEASTGQKSEKSGRHGAAVKHSFLEMDPLIFPVLNGTGTPQTINLIVTLEVESEEASAEVRYMSPRLKDAYIQEMYGVLNRESAMKDGVVQISMIKRHLDEASDRVMGRDVIKDVLIQVIEQRPM